MRLLTLTICVLFFVACNRKAVQLEYTNAKGEVPQLGNLVFRFNQPLVNDSMLNIWDSTAFVVFEPAVNGRFRWQQTDELVFSPAQPLPPSTNFTARITSEVLASSEFNTVAGADKIAFNTPSLKLEDVQVSWMPAQGKNSAAFPRADLFFNYRISPADIKNKISVEIEGKPVVFDLLTVSDDNRISLALKNIEQVDKSLEGKISLEKGLLPAGGKNATSEPINATYSIPSPFVLAVNDVSSEHDGLTGTVIVSTSQQLSNSNIISQIGIEPAVKFSVESTDEGFQIKSDQFDADKSYTLTLKKGIRGNVGGILQEEYNNNIAFGQLEPSVNFTNKKSVYLSSKGNRLIEVKIVNVPKVKIIISKIYESNLLAARNYGYEPREANNNEEEMYSSDYYNYSMSMGDIVYESEIETSSLPKLGNSRLFSFNIEDRLPDFKGIYHIRVRSAQNYWMSDSRFIALSDIGLIAREGTDKLYVFANSVRTADPQEGVNIVAYGNNNQVLAMGATNAQGVAELSYSRKEFAGFKPAMIVAKTENDFNYMPFGNTQVNTSRFDIGGKKINNTALDAFIYAERDIYRPGERLNFSVIVRDPSWNIPGQIPLKFRMLYPNGKEFRAFRKTLNEQGSAEAQVDIPSASITGTYILEVYSSNDILIGTGNFNIEEFVPDRLKVTTQLDRKFLQPAEQSKLSINAINFFGPPAAGRNYELEIQLKTKDFSSKKYPNYSFGIKNKGLSVDNILRQGKLDNAGNAVETYEVPAMFRNSGLLQASFYSTVFDETGRPVSRLTSADVFTQPAFFGVAEDDYWYYALNQPVKFPIIVLDRDQKLLSGIKANVKVIKHEYRTVLAKSGGYFRYESQENDKIVSDQIITINGESTIYQFVPRTPGNYELRVSFPGANNYVARSFYSYGSWGGDANSFEVDNDGNIDIETDKSVYQPGDKARLLFKAPFNGKMLVTVEQNQVLSYQYVAVSDRNASIEIPVSAAHLPNAFITATLIKPHGNSEIPLTVAHGFQNMRVEEKKRHNKIEIVAAKNSRSNTVQEITVKALPGSYVTLAAVDNGVLQVSDFKTPDPYGYFYANRALQVSAYDMYPLLFPELRSRLSSTGGDAEMDMQKRVNPMPARRIKILSSWSGILKTNGNGTAKIKINIPAFSGQIRLMAVAYHNENFGAAEATMTVADPIVISTGFPRFLSPGDTIRVPVTITNTLSKSISGTATLRPSKALTVVGASTQPVTLSANSEGRPGFNIVAGPSIDTANLSIEINAAGEKFVESIAVGIRPIVPLSKFNASGLIAAGKPFKPLVSPNNFIAGSERYSLVLSRNPAAILADQLRYIVQYPFGCTEQVVSAAFPQLYFADLSAQVSENNPGTSNANRNIIEAIRTIKLRQLYNGALTLWEGEGTVDWWTTIYATHFLLEAKKAGFDVDASLINSLLDYLNSRLRNKVTINYYYNRDQNKKIAPKEIAYSLYVLSLASLPNMSAMNYYKANISVLSLDSRYLLSAAYASAGDKRKFAESLPGSFTREVSVPQTGGSFYSPIRDEAIALNALIDMDPSNKQIPIMAKHVSDQIRNSRWYNTQECAFSFLALGKLARAAAKSSAEAEVRINNKVVAKFTGKDMRYEFEGVADNLKVAVTGAGDLYYYLYGEGISASGEYREEDSYIKVRRRFFDRNGNAITGNTFRRNDLVIAQITLEKAFNTRVENIVVTDMLPAGFEIENPRTKELPGMEWIRDASVPTHLDVRDDRLNLFVDLTEAKQVYYYAVRAVSPGVFNIGPVAADAMYNGEYHSYHGAGKIRINE